MIKQYTLDDINTFSPPYRAHFINSLSGFKSSNLVGTKDKKGQENLCIVSSAVHIGASPPTMGLIFRPNTVPRHSFENILSTQFFTLNHVHNSILKQSHQTSANYPKDVSEFEAVGLTPIYNDPIKAPFVKEAFIKIGLKFVERYDIQFNKTHFIIGHIMFVEFNDDLLDEEGRINIQQAQTICASGLDRYHTTTLLNQLEKATPNIV